MAYPLTTAVTQLKNTTNWLTRRVAKQPIDGIVDGDNLLFTLPIAPAVDGTLTLYVGGTAIPSASYTPNYDTGEIEMDTPPPDVVYATYTAQAYTDAELLEIVKNGFDKMETEYPRGWYIYSDNISTGLSANVEPSVNGIALSDNRVQQRLLNLCCRYELCSRLYEDASLHDHVYRESGRIGGLMVDLSKRPENIQRMIDNLQVQIAQAVSAAAAQAGDTDQFGNVWPGAKSDEYVDGYEWWPDSKQERGIVE